MLAGRESLSRSEFCRSDVGPWGDPDKDDRRRKTSRIESILDCRLIGGERLPDPVGVAISG